MQVTDKVAFGGVTLPLAFPLQVSVFLNKLFSLCGLWDWVHILDHVVC